MFLAILWTPQCLQYNLIMIQTMRIVWNYSDALCFCCYFTHFSLLCLQSIAFCSKWIGAIWLSFFHLFHNLTPDGCDAVVSSFLTFFQNVVFINIWFKMIWILQVYFELQFTAPFSFRSLFNPIASSSTYFMHPFILSHTKTIVSPHLLFSSLQQIKIFFQLSSTYRSAFISICSRALHHCHNAITRGGAQR